jgi:hypothetical protein
LKAAQLNLLASGDVENAVSEPARNVSDGAKLPTIAEAVGHAHAHHPPPRSWLAKEHANPLQQIFLGVGERFVALGNQARQVFADA